VCIYCIDTKKKLADCEPAQLSTNSPNEETLRVPASSCDYTNNHVEPLLVPGIALTALIADNMSGTHSLKSPDRVLHCVEMSQSAPATVSSDEESGIPSEVENSCSSGMCTNYYYYYYYYFYTLGSKDAKG